MTNTPRPDEVPPRDGGAGLNDAIRQAAGRGRLTVEETATSESLNAAIRRFAGRSTTPEEER